MVGGVCASTAGLILDQGTEISRATWFGRKKKKEYGLWVEQTKT